MTNKNKDWGILENADQSRERVLRYLKEDHDVKVLGPVTTVFDLGRLREMEAQRARAAELLKCDVGALVESVEKLLDKTDHLEQERVGLIHKVIARGLATPEQLARWRAEGVIESE